jgi:outer membrane protein OmpA-like peptidoglycan-associated protein
VRRFFTILSLLISALTFGQQHLLVTGTVTDTATGKPVANAIVALRGPDTTIETHTDTSGKYIFSDGTLKTDKIYVLSAYCDNPKYGTVGKEEYFSTYSLKGNSHKYLRNILVERNAENDELIPAEGNRLGKIYFKLKDVKIANPERDTVLNGWLQYLLNNPTYVVEIAGYADEKDGTKMLQNMTSKGRSQECIDYLHTHGISYDQLRLAGYGTSMPAVSEQTIHKLKDDNAKIAAREQNCFAELRLRSIFFKPMPTVLITGMVTDINTLLPVKRALLQFYGNDGSKLTTETDNNGFYSISLKGFNPLVTYILGAGAIGYDACDSTEMLKIWPGGYDQLFFTKNYNIAKHGFETQPIFPPIRFDSGSAALSTAAKDTLNRLKAFMNSKPGLVMKFMGDADWRELDYVNLAAARARACINYLVSLGIDNARLQFSNRINMEGVEITSQDTPGLVKKKEVQTRFNHRTCSVAFWPVNWKYGQ